MNRSVSVVVVVLLVASVGALGLAPGAATATAVDDGAVDRPTHHEPSVESQFQTQTAESVGSTEDFDQTIYEITVHENGSATWTFQHRVYFDGNDSDEERDAFESFADEFESEETDLYHRFVNQSHTLTEADVDREMEATEFQRSAGIEDPALSDEYGYLELSFTWVGFAEVDDGSVYVGDVFENIYLYPDQSIAIEAGDGLTFDRVQPSATAQYTGGSLEDADRVEWSGEQSFLDGQPSAVLLSPDAGSAGSVLPGGGDVSDTWLAAVVVVLVLVGLGAGAVWWSRERDDGFPIATDSADEPTETDSATSPPDDSAETADAEPLADEELLTDEDRVVKLIRENGGRMKQVNIVEETGWSKSKVSMLLSDMEEDGTISKLRVGRENIISLEGFEPEATKSPFEE